MLSVYDAYAVFPAPKFRKYQRTVIEKIVEAFNSDFKVILLEAPTGFGKSLVNTTFCRLLKPCFYATPQLSLIDQIKTDKYIGADFVEIKGRQNYYCAYDPKATVDIGVCRRIKGFECDKEFVCPYWIQKLKALAHPEVLMSFSYLFLEGFTETKYSFGKRQLLTLDESHSIDRHVINHIKIEISPNTVPERLYEYILDSIKRFEEFEDLFNFMNTLYEAVEIKIKELLELLDVKELSIEEAEELVRLQEFKRRIELFLDYSDETDWIWKVKFFQTEKGMKKGLVLYPVYANIFMADTIWTKADYFIVSSATILDPYYFVKETGLNIRFKTDQILYIKVASTFPPENRPIIDWTVGKMTKREKIKNVDNAIKRLEEIIEENKGKNIAVHCHSYENVYEILEKIDKKYKDKIIYVERGKREERLKEWMNSRGKVFLAVGFEEGQNWIGDICEVQVLYKVPYPDLSDERVKRRLEKGEYRWYFNETLKKVIQSYGRAVRTETDKQKYYVIDSSFWDLIKRTKRYLPLWFKDALPSHWKEFL